MKVLDIADRIKSMPDNQVAAEVAAAIGSLVKNADVSGIERLVKGTMDICHDRITCSRLGINYNRMNLYDFNRARLFAYYREPQRLRYICHRS